MPLPNEVDYATVQLSQVRENFIYCVVRSLDIMHYEGIERLWFPFLFVLCQCLSYIASAHTFYFIERIGINAVSSVKALIYKKCLRISPASGEQFTLGEITNFLQTDVGRIKMIAENIESVARLPL